MAKAKEITGLDCAADALLWATEVLRVRSEEVVSLREAALDFSDIEGVHAMRVATRRLRSALRDFLPLMEKRAIRRMKKDLKQLADALGSVRDQDVAILALEKLQSGTRSKQIKDGLETLLRERRGLRELARVNLTEILTVNHLEKLHEDFRLAVDRAFKKNKRGGADSFNEIGRKVVAASLEEMYALGLSLYHPNDIEEIHELRIAAKRLRYAVELFMACWGEKIAPFAGEIAGMQSFLGEIHDCDVWIESLGKRLRKNANDSPEEYQAAVWLMSEYVRERTKNYRAALKLWGKWQADNFMERMRTMIA